MKNLNERLESITKLQIEERNNSPKTITIQSCKEGVFLHTTRESNYDLNGYRYVTLNYWINKEAPFYMSLGFRINIDIDYKN
jgi:hypothetical protein